MENKNIKLGLFGFGCVGQGLYDVLNDSQGLKANIEKICVKDKTKKRKIDSSNFSFDREDILKRKDLNAVVEMIDNTKEAFEIVSQAMKNKMNVVSASKKMLAEYFEELFKLQEEHKVSLLYEASAGGSIPIIRTLEEYYDNELLSSIRGILNGTSNYVLSKMELENLDYEVAIKGAQESGFAETDPWLDVGGFDTKYKILLLTVHAFGILLKPDQILNLGINNISYDDIIYAREKGLRIKLLGRAEKVGNKYRVFALPHFVGKDSELFSIMQEYNAVEVEGAFSCKQTFVGKGAGSHPTGSAVLSDISALTYDYKYGYKKLKNLKGKLNGSYNMEDLLDTDFDIKVYIRYRNETELKPLEILSVEEEYYSKKTHFIVANVKFKSLFNIYNKRDNKLFVCVV